MARHNQTCPALCGPLNPTFLLDTNRIEWNWIAGENGKPGLPADFDSATEATMNITDPLVTLLGTNAASALVSNSVEGGIDVLTGAVDNDQMILVPHEDTNANQMHPDTLTWGSDREVVFECSIKTPSALTTMTMVMGLTLDASPAVMSVTSPDDFMLFEFESDTPDTTWQIVSDVANGGPVTLDSEVPVVASTNYHFMLVSTPDQILHAYINGMEFTSVAYAANEVDLIPMIGYQSLGTNGSPSTLPLRVFGWRIGRLLSGGS